MAGRTHQKKSPNSHKLTDQQVLFCRLYAQTLNSEQSYIGAGYKARSSAVARAASSRLLTNANVQAYLKEVMALDEVSTLNAVTAIALCEITEILSWDGKELIVKQTDKWSDRAKLAVKKFKYRSKTTITESGDTFVDTEAEVEMYDRLNALDKLMRKMKLYPKDEPVAEVNAGDNKPASDAKEIARNIVLEEVFGINNLSDNAVKTS